MDCPHCECKATKFCDGCDERLCDGCYECHNSDHILGEVGCHMMGTCNKELDGGTCDDCGAMVVAIIGTPDGAEICYACFDKGNH